MGTRTRRTGHGARFAGLDEEDRRPLEGPVHRTVAAHRVAQRAGG